MISAGGGGSALLKKVCLGVVGRHRAVRYGGHHLAQRLCAHVTHCEYAGEVGPGGLIRLDITGGIQLQLLLEPLCGGDSADADKDAVTGEFGFRAGSGILQPDAGQTVAVEQLRYGAVPVNLYVCRVQQGFVCLLYTSDAADEL